MTFCYSAMNGLSINSFGRVRPCCVVSTMRTTMGTPGVTEVNDLDFINTYPYKVAEDGKIGYHPHGNFGWCPKIQEAKHVYDLVNDVLLCDLRKDLLNGDRPSVCQRCFPIEDQGGVSFRMNYNKDHAEYAVYDSVEPDGTIKNHDAITYLDITLGNTCNLQCKTCNPWSSHNWLKEVKVLPHQDYDDNGSVEKGTANPWYVKAFAHRDEWGNGFFDPILPNVRTINFLGGEPLVVKEHDDWLQYIIDKDWASNKKLQYTTNGTTIPNKLIDTWKNFERINLGISIDAIGDLAGYVRYPSKWNVIAKNFDKLRHRCKVDAKNIYVQMHTTISSLNVQNIEEIYDFSAEQYSLWHYWDDDKKRQHGYINMLPHINMVDFPTFYHVRQLPDEMKDNACKVIDRTYNKYKDRVENEWELSNLENLINLKKSVMQERDPAIWQQFIDVQIASDKFRGVSITDHLPWMNNYV